MAKTKTRFVVIEKTGDKLSELGRCDTRAKARDAAEKALRDGAGIVEVWRLREGPVVLGQDDLVSSLPKDAI